MLGGNAGTPEGELLNGIKAQLAVYENRQRVERTVRGMDGRVRAGHVLVGPRPPYGYCYIGGDRTGRLEPDPQEAPVVERIFRWCVDDALATHAIAQRLHAEHVPTRGDTNPVVAKASDRCVWAPQTVARILRNATYKGEWHWGKTRMAKAGDRKAPKPRPEGEWLAVDVPALVDPVTWERAQAQLDRNKQMARRNAKRTYLLSGLVFCPCGRRWIGRYNRERDRGLYRCPTTPGEPWREGRTARFGIEQGKLERALLGAVKAFLLDPEVRRVALDAERERAADARDRAAGDLAALDARLVKVERQLAKLLDALLVEDFPADVVAARKRDLLAERAQVAADREQRLAALAEPVIDVEAAVADMAPTVEAAFAHAEPSELRRLLDLLRVEVHVIDRETVRLSGVLGSVVTLRA